MPDEPSTVVPIRFYDGGNETLTPKHAHDDADPAEKKSYKDYYEANRARNPAVDPPYEGSTSSHEPVHDDAAEVRRQREEAKNREQALNGRAAELLKREKALEERERALAEREADAAAQSQAHAKAATPDNIPEAPASPRKGRNQAK